MRSLTNKEIAVKLFLRAVLIMSQRPPCIKNAY